MRKEILWLTLSDAPVHYGREGWVEKNSYFNGGRRESGGVMNFSSFLFYSVWIPSLRRVPPTSGGSSPLVNSTTRNTLKDPGRDLLYKSPVYFSIQSS